MAKIDSLEIELISNEEIGKLEKVKWLLAEIKQLKEEIFGKQPIETDEEFKKRVFDVLNESYRSKNGCGKSPLKNLTSYDSAPTLP